MVPRFLGLAQFERNCKMPILKTWFTCVADCLLKLETAVFRFPVRAIAVNPTDRPTGCQRSKLRKGTPTVPLGPSSTSSCRDNDQIFFQLNAAAANNKNQKKTFFLSSLTRLDWRSHSPSKCCFLLFLSFFL